MFLPQKRQSGRQKGGGPIKRRQKRRLQKAALSVTAVLAVALFAPTLPSHTLQTQPEASASPAAEPTAAPRPTPSAATPEPSATAEPTARPTLEPLVDYVALTEEKLKELEKLAQEDTKEKSYDSADEYFGGDWLDYDDDFIVTMPVIPAPTPEPTPVPTTAPTPEPAGSSESAAGSQPASETEQPPAETPAPTPPPADGPALQCTDPAYTGQEQIRLYNAWPDEYKYYAWSAARSAGVSYELVLAIIYHESRFQAGATHLNTNGTTDWGLMQINDVCFSFVAARVEGVGSMADLLDPYKNIQAGCALLAYHMAATGNENDALLRYQVGAGNYVYYKENGKVPLSYTNTISIRDTYRAAGV